MKTLEQELNELDAEHAKKRVDTARKHEILSHFAPLIDGYGTPSVFFYKLYNTRGTVSFKICNYDSLRTGKNPDVALLRTLLASYCPEPKVLNKDGMISGFSMPGEQGSLATMGQNSTSTPVFPVTVRLFARDRKASYEWVAKIGDEYWGIHVELPFSTRLGTLDVRYSESPAFREHILVCNYTAKGAGAFRLSRVNEEFDLYWNPDAMTIEKLCELAEL
jgi:hypothetical protein